MIRERVEAEEFTLEITLKLKNSEAEVAYKEYIKSIVSLIAGGLCSGELFPLFMKELMKVADNMLHTIQTERALKGAD